MPEPCKDSRGSPDSAAVLGCALSLWIACHQSAAKDPAMNLAVGYDGLDEFMRQAMCVASLFESWACDHVEFEETTEVWPYFLKDRFGDACLEFLPATALSRFSPEDCLRVALRLRLPIRIDGILPVPVDVRAINPIAASGFREYRIQSVRNGTEYGDVVPFTPDDDPFDDEFGPPYFALYGVDASGTLEHIADRRSYPEILGLAKNIAPGVTFYRLGN